MVRAMARALDRRFGHRKALAFPTRQFGDRVRLTQLAGEPAALSGTMVLGFSTIGHLEQ
jgi:hypothetical protein